MHILGKIKIKLLLLIFFPLLFAASIGGALLIQANNDPVKIAQAQDRAHWFVLHRKSNTEELYFGVPGEKNNSKLIKTFKVKTGEPGQRPTPLPQKLGRQYWKIIEKHPEFENPETAPYFLTLDIPAPTGEPYGPVPYEECNGQCNWVVPGNFGLHGTGDDPTRITDAFASSSGCIRHFDEDIEYLYQLLDPTKEEIRYYIFED